MLLEPGPLFREEEAGGEEMEAGKCFVLEE